MGGEEQLLSRRWKSTHGLSSLPAVKQGASLVPHTRNGYVVLAFSPWPLGYQGEIALRLKESVWGFPCLSPARHSSYTLLPPQKKEPARKILRWSSPGWRRWLASHTRPHKKASLPLYIDLFVMAGDRQKSTRGKTDS